MTTQKTIIVGGGIAGLSCAKTLAARGSAFVLISKDIGGRIHSSSDGVVNYGAVWTVSDYTHVRSFVSLGRRVGYRDLAIYRQGVRQSISNILKKYPMQLIRIFFSALRFFFKYAEFKRQCETVGQKEAIESDPYIHALYTQSAQEFAEKHKIQNFVHEILSPGLRAIYLTAPHEENAFNLMRLCLGLFESAYEFQFNKHDAIAPFAESLQYDEVTEIRFSEGGTYLVSTLSGKCLETQNLVMATPLSVTEKLLNIHTGRWGRAMHVLHVRGSINHSYTSGVFKGFEDSSEVVGIYTQVDGTYLVYSTRENPELGQFFDSFTMIAAVSWDPLYPNIGKELVDPNPQKGLFIIGDHTIPGLEDACITGIYAANRILASQ